MKEKLNNAWLSASVGKRKREELTFEETEFSIAKAKRSCVDYPSKIEFLLFFIYL